MDIHNREIFPAVLTIGKDRIINISKVDDCPDVYILPGLIDSHIHIESSMLTPGAFGYAAVEHGTTGVVSDPHEIANVIGLKGIEFMISDSAKSPVRFWFGAPSCVPATQFETSGAEISVDDIEKLLKRDDIKYLSEMMNYPGVIYNDRQVLSKIDSAVKNGKPVDGHAPGLTGEGLKKYVSAGITTDHECTSLEEAKEKIGLGMKILIREGSAARNLESLKDLYRTNPGMLMLCSDDLHPEMLERGHINKLISGLVSEGFDPFDVLRSATINPVEHYKLEAGLLKVGQSADLIVVDNLKSMNVKETWIAGKKVYDNGVRNFVYNPGRPLNNFNCRKIKTTDIQITCKPGLMRVIEAYDGDLRTGEIHKQTGNAGIVDSDIPGDILKIIVKDRYQDHPPAKAFIKGFGLKKGAFASSIAHDSHNIVAIGTNDKDIIKAVNEIVDMKGGLAVSVNESVSSLELNIAGIMSGRPCWEIATEYKKLNEQVKSLGCRMAAPFMTLSFMALLVIPYLKIGDRGLFDVKSFKPVPLVIDQELI